MNWSTTLRRWSHHCNVSTCDDDILRQAMGDDNTVSAYTRAQYTFASARRGSAVYCIGLDWNGLDWIGLDWIVLDWIVLYCIVLYCIVLYYFVVYCIVLCCIVLYCVVLCCAMLCCVVG